MNMTYLLDVANHTGVVTRISLVFRRHGANLHSLSTAKTEHASIVRIVVTADLMPSITTDLAWTSLSLIHAPVLLINSRIRLDIRLASWNAAQ